MRTNFLLRTISSVFLFSFALSACASPAVDIPPTSQVVEETPTSSGIQQAIVSTETTGLQSGLFQISIVFPASWKKVDGYAERYQGADGYFSLGAKSNDSVTTLQFACEDEINHVLKPFGSQASIQYITVDGQEACLILPSEDQVKDMNGEAEVLVRYPQPVMVNGSTAVFLQVFAGKGYIMNLVGTVKFLRITTSVPLSLDILKNSQYRSPDWGEFQLTDGKFYRPPAAPGESAEIYQTQLSDKFAFGDLNRDGTEDAIVFLYTQNGGTGHFVEMASMLNLNGSALNISTISLGDREAIMSVQIVNGVVLLDIVSHGPNDPLCCPSQQKKRQYQLEDGQLVRLE